MRGEMVDIGGRRLHLIREGPQGARPVLLLEAGAFGFSADFGALQAMLAERGMRVLAYDRAGLGASDPGPEPRDGLSVIGDLETLLGAAREEGPFILVGHSMAGLYLRLFANRNPDKVVGLVLVDAATPEATDGQTGQRFATQFARVSRLAIIGARIGLYAPLSRTWLGDKIGLPLAASAEKRAAFASTRHNRWASAEVDQWLATAEQAKATGPLDPRLPVAVITAGYRRVPGEMSPTRAAPARLSAHGYAEVVAGASHTTLLGPNYAEAIARGVDHVREHAA